MAAAFEVPVGNGLSLRCVQNNLFRNTNAATQFPYPIGDMGELTDDALGNEYYYYFYDWKVQKKSYECVSDRVAVTVGVSATGEILEQEGVLSISPNPALDAVWFDISGKARASLLRVFDPTGREVSRRELAGNRGNLLSVKGFAAGIYLVKVETDLGTISTKLVVE
jgi:hypothetical protein